MLYENTYNTTYNKVKNQQCRDEELLQIVFLVGRMRSLCDYFVCCLLPLGGGDGDGLRWCWNGEQLLLVGGQAVISSFPSLPQRNSFQACADGLVYSWLVAYLSVHLLMQSLLLLIAALAFCTALDK